MDKSSYQGILSDQMRRVVVSIARNIAEGQDRNKLKTEN